MVRGRRVKGIVACTRGNDCCSPKRKDQRLEDKGSQKLVHKILSPSKTQNITDFFKTASGISESKCDAISDPNDVDASKPCRTRMTLRKNHQFQMQVDLLTKATNEILNGQDIKLQNTQKEKETEPNKKPATPHRIVACPDIDSQVFPKEKKTQPYTKRRLNDGQTTNSNEIMKQINGKDHSGDHKLTDFFPVRRSVRKTKRTVLEEKQRNLENILRKNVEEGMEVHNFEGKGRGVVATKPFKRGDFVVEYSGELIEITEAKRREDEYAQDQTTGCYMYYFCHKNKQYCVDATAETGRLGRLVNHSRNGNLITRTVLVDGVPRLILIAKEDIQVGKELTYDYGDRSKESLKHHPWLAY